MAKTGRFRAAAGDRPKGRPAQVEPEQPSPFPAHLPDPPRKNPAFLLIAIGLLLAWLLALVVMSIVA